MTQAQIICGKTLAAVVDEEVKEAVASLYTSFGKTPKLTVVVVGDDPASTIYVNNKVKRCRKVGIESQKLALDANITLADLTQVIRDLSAEPETHGILLQLPLPNGMNARKILHEIAPEKDVDGFHPLNFGSFMAGGAGCTGSLHTSRLPASLKDGDRRLSWKGCDCYWVLQHCWETYGGAFASARL